VNGVCSSDIILTLLLLEVWEINTDFATNASSPARRTGFTRQIAKTNPSLFNYRTGRWRKIGSLTAILTHLRDATGNIQLHRRVVAATCAAFPAFASRPRSGRFCYRCRHYFFLPLQPAQGLESLQPPQGFFFITIGFVRFIKILTSIRFYLASLPESASSA
jgi:hypothetical protein